MITYLILATLTLWSSAALTGPYDPEETLFVFARCIEDNLKDDANRAATFEKWRNWDLEPADDRSTHCHVKCAFEKLGIYDPESKRFNSDVIQNQWNQYPELVDKSKADAYIDALKKLPATDNDCTAVFKAYEPVHHAHKEASRNLLHGNRELFPQVYKKLGASIRQMGQSYFEFCENKHYPVGSPDRQKLCQIRQYTVLNDDQFKQHTDCIFKGLRYVSKDNVLDREEIKRDFREVDKDTAQLEQVLDHCQSDEPKEASEVAWHYYKCLVESSVVDDFKEAFDYREVRSKNYAYHLRQRQTYSRPQVQSEVMEIDGKQCPQ